MPDSSPTDLLPPADGEVPSDEAPKAPADEAPAKTVEEVEAIWRNRVSQKDKAHAAEVAALREDRDLHKTAAERLAEEKRTVSEGSMTELEQWKSKAERLEQDAENERRTRIKEVRAAKYAQAAEVLDDAALMAMDEGKLAALNARLSADTGQERDLPPQDPNAARRTNGSPTSPRDKSDAELSADLKRLGPAWLESVRDS